MLYFLFYCFNNSRNENKKYEHLTGKILRGMKKKKRNKKREGFSQKQMERNKNSDKRTTRGPLARIIQFEKPKYTSRYKS